LTFEILLLYNEDAGWRGILLSPASFAFETLAPRQPVSFFIPLLGNVLREEGKKEFYPDPDGLPILGLGLFRRRLELFGDGRTA